MLIAFGVVGCGDSTVTFDPEMPGTIVLTTVTSGFLKDDSYELFVGGESRGTIQANGELTISDLDPATYTVDLGDVADNCTTEGDSVEVASEETVNISLSVDCSFSTSTSYTVRFSRERPNLENGEIIECPFQLCPAGAEWHLYVHNNSQTTPHAVIRQNQTTAIEIAHVPGVALGDLSEEDFTSASFTTDLVSDPFDTGRVILIRTDTGTVYALGNPVEDAFALTLTFDAALIVQP